VTFGHTVWGWCLCFGHEMTWSSSAQVGMGLGVLCIYKILRDIRAEHNSDEGQHASYINT
jgi:hypothetical protein